MLIIAAVLVAPIKTSAAAIPLSASLAERVAQARDGDTVLVEGPAVFGERLVINKSLRLVGTNRPVLDAGGEGTPLTIIAPDVVVEGFTIRNSGRDLTAFDSGIMISGARATVRNCRVEVDGFGIYVRGVSECVIEGNRIAGQAHLSSAARGNGLHLWKTRENRIVRNEIRDKRDGLYLSYADSNLIAENRIQNTRFGIHYMYSHQNRLIANRLTHNTVGATLMFSRQSVVVSNIVSGNLRHGMVLKQLDRSRVAHNVVVGHNRGLFVQQSSQNRFESNLVATNDIGLYLSNASEENVFVGNAFVKNADQVWQPPFESAQGRRGPNAFSQNGRGNFWSEYAGSDRNHDGIGDTPYHETDVFGYIVDRHPAARVLALSPAVALLRKGEERLPVLDLEGVTDFAPLMKWSSLR